MSGAYGSLISRHRFRTYSSELARLETAFEPNDPLGDATLAALRSEWVAAFNSEYPAGFIGIRTRGGSPVTSARSAPQQQWAILVMRNLLFGAGATRTLYDVPAVIAPQKKRSFL